MPHRSFLSRIQAIEIYNWLIIIWTLLTSVLVNSSPGSNLLPPQPDLALLAAVSHFTLRIRSHRKRSSWNSYHLPSNWCPSSWPFFPALCVNLIQKKYAFRLTIQWSDILPSLSRFLWISWIFSHNDVIWFDSFSWKINFSIREPNRFRFQTPNDEC